MRKFRLLLIDDDPSLQQIKDKFAGVETTICENVEDARREILLGFFDLAIVDLELPRAPLQEGQAEGDRKVELLAGKDCCRWLCKFMPRCERIIRSRNVEELKVKDLLKYPNRDPLFPGTPLASAIVPKGDIEDSLEKIVERRRTHWLARSLKVEFSNLGVAPRLGEKVNGWVQAIRHSLGEEIKPFLDAPGKAAKNQLKESLKLEVEFLISQLCGLQYISELSFNKLETLHGNSSGHSESAQLRNDKVRELLTSPLMEAISVSELEIQGRSSALTFRGQPTLFGVKSDVWLLIKVDLLDRIEQEVAAYNRYMRLVVSRSRRTELLGFAAGNRLGAICYTFIGEGGQQPTQLTVNLDTGPAKVTKVIQNLFGTRDLHAIRNEEKRLGAINYFKQRLEAPSDWSNLWQSVLSFAKEQHPGLDGKYDEIRAPTKTERFEASYPVCLSHGDVHFGNIVGLNPDSIVLIDYRDSGWAPRVLDYIVFESSLRMNIANEADSIDEIAKLNNHNTAILQSHWNPDGEPVHSSEVVAVAATELNRHLQEAFGGDVTSAEYCSIALAWNLLLASNKGIEDPKRLGAAFWALDLGHFLSVS